MELNANYLYQFRNFEDVNNGNVANISAQFSNQKQQVILQV